MVVGVATWCIYKVGGQVGSAVGARSGEGGGVAAALFLVGATISKVGL